MRFSCYPRTNVKSQLSKYTAVRGLHATLPPRLPAYAGFRANGAPHWHQPDCPYAPFFKRSSSVWQLDGQAFYATGGQRVMPNVGRHEMKGDLLDHSNRWIQSKGLRAPQPDFLLPTRFWANLDLGRSARHLRPPNAYQYYRSGHSFLCVYCPAGSIWTHAGCIYYDWNHRGETWRKSPMETFWEP